MKTLLTLCLMCFNALTAFSQTSSGMISGTIKGTDNDVIPGATVRLMISKDSSMVKGEISNGNGKFQFSNLQNNTYVLVITAIGQKQYKSVPLLIDDSHPVVTLPVIILLPAKNIQLKEVVVSAKKPLIEQDIDRTIVNVESMIGSATSNTLEVLGKTPGVSVDNNGEISLNGRTGILVLIDGRSTYMSGQDLASYLKSLPGGVLDKIELMDNPSAKYDAAGNAIINIRLKKNRTGGFTGSVSAGYSQGRYARNNDALSLNYNHRKINLFTNIGYNIEKNYTYETYYRKFYNTEAGLCSSLDLVNNQVGKNTGQSINLGLDFTASPKTTLGAIVNLNGGKGKNTFDYEGNNFNAGHQLTGLNTGNTLGKSSRTNLSTNLNMLHKFDNKGKELSADVNYIRYISDGDQALQNFIYQADGTLASRHDFLYILPSNIGIYTAKADYVQPFKNKVRLEAGFKSSVIDNENISDYYDLEGPIQSIDNSKSNHFKYHENINAAYVNSQKAWKRLGVQLGLRVESTQARGKQLGNEEVSGSSFTKNYTSLFPSAFVSYKLDSVNKNTLTLMMVRRIARPNYQSLNPFLFFRDQYSYSSGNPMLKPQYQSRVELKFQHKQLLNMGLSYNWFTDIFLPTTEAAGNVFITRSDNVAKGFMFLLNTTLSLSPTKWWNFNPTLRLSRMGIEGKVYTENLDFVTNVARLEFNNYFTFSKTLSGELIGYYASTDLNGQQVTSGMYRLGAALQKKILKGKGSIRVSADDIFHSWVYERKSISLKQAESFQTSASDTQRIGFAFTYRFGKETFARKRRHNDNAAEAEKGRVD
ncbi:outer membrane beta-barrel protein [Emticicia sp. CRIBPO]|uniref:outer membrane beta-barrel family protein n=1 Tax=Emticicia sp. CRIBPO TaxID=2683258 RepID=UPI001412A658|nr:outer membrane beta-barrel family protein [Emticicia sp. CRIBPO]NBA86127.1 outer membrane beta-barrel protein [Emticicia sp. CRIBPO]